MTRSLHDGLKKCNKLHATALLIFPGVLCGCASNLTTYALQPELIYISGEPESTQITLQQIQNIEHGVVTPEGLKDSVVSSDYKYSLNTADNKTIKLPFLDAANASSEAHIDHVFYSAINSSWIASSVVLSTHMEHVNGLFEWKNVDDLFVAVHIKAFTKDALVSQKIIEVCNPSEARNPVIRYDKSRSALQYCGKNGTAVYFPLTQTFKIESSNSCCPGSPEQGHFGTRLSRKTFFEEATITNSN